MPYDFFASDPPRQALAAQRVLPFVEAPGQGQAQQPVEQRVGQIRLSAAAVQGGENIGGGKNIHHADGEDQSQTLDAVQVIGKKAGHGHHKGLRQDDAPVGGQGRQAYTDGGLVLAFIHCQQRAADVFRLVGGLIDGKKQIGGPVGAHLVGLDLVPGKKAEHGGQQIRQAVIHDKDLHDGRHGPHKGDPQDQKRPEDSAAAPAVQAGDGDHSAENDAQQHSDRRDQQCVGQGFQDKKESGDNSVGVQSHGSGPPPLQKSGVPALQPAQQRFQNADEQPVEQSHAHITFQLALALVHVDQEIGASHQVHQADHVHERGILDDLDHLVHQSRQHDGQRLGQDDAADAPPGRQAEGHGGLVLSLVHALIGGTDDLGDDGPVVHEHGGVNIAFLGYRVAVQSHGADQGRQHKVAQKQQQHKGHAAHQAHPQVGQAGQQRQARDADGGGGRSRQQADEG